MIIYAFINKLTKTSVFHFQNLKKAYILEEELLDIVG